MSLWSNGESGRQSASNNMPIKSTGQAKKDRMVCMVDC
jgi:hypothetical protein